MWSLMMLIYLSVDPPGFAQTHKILLLIKCGQRVIKFWITSKTASREVHRAKTATINMKSPLTWCHVVWGYPCHCHPMHRLQMNWPFWHIMRSLAIFSSSQPSVECLFFSEIWFIWWRCQFWQVVDTSQHFAPVCGARTGGGSLLNTSHPLSSVARSSNYRQS